MTPKLKEKLLSAITVIETAKTEVAEGLKNTPYSNLIISSNNSFDQLLNKFRHIAGVVIAANDTLPEFEPIKSFMGEDIKTAKEIKPEELKVEDTEMNIFKGKVNKLYNEFDSMDNDTILKTYVAEPNVIRGVAKKAGIEEFQDKELNHEFIDEIRTVKKTKDTLAKQLATAKNTTPTKGNSKGKNTAAKKANIKVSTPVT